MRSQSEMVNILLQCQQELKTKTEVLRRKVCVSSAVMPCNFSHNDNYLLLNHCTTNIFIKLEFPWKPVIDGISQSICQIVTQTFVLKRQE